MDMAPRDLHGGVDAELFAIGKALSQAEEFLTTYKDRGRTCPIRKIYIFSDSQSGMKRMNNLTTRPGQTVGDPPNIDMRTANQKEIFKYYYTN